MITHHTQLLNALIEKYNLKSYLEIGVQNPANNFDKVNCYLKTGVDPEIIGEIGPSYTLYKITSDDFFNLPPKYEGHAFKFDLIFIDGLHTAEQVQRDFENSLRCLSDNGFIVIHDVLPENEAGTKVPRETRQWWGDVYKWAMNICKYDGIQYKTFNIDNGCMLVWKDNNKKGSFLYSSSGFDWVAYQTTSKILMNVTSTVEI